MMRKRKFGSACSLMLILIWNACPVHAYERVDPPGVEPTVTREESEQIASASSLFDINPRAAIEQMQAQTGPKASAALDFSLATMLAKEERFAESAIALYNALDKFPSFQRAWLLMGRVSILKGETSKAIKPLREALKFGADQAEAFKLLAYCHIANGHAVAAESAYRHVLSLEPEDRETTAGLAQSLLMQERVEDAAPLLRVLCEKVPGKAEYWIMRANTEMVRGDHRRAIVLLECARRLSEVDQQSLLALGDLYFNEGLYEKATSCYSDAGRRDELSTARLVRYAEALLNAGQAVLAVKLVRPDLPEDKDRPDRLHIVRAKIAQANQDTASARIHLDSALRVCPMSGDALLMLARIQKEEGDLDRAVLTLERASRVESHKRRALLEIAQIHVDRSQYDKALELLDEAQSLQFEPSVARYADQIRQAKASQE